MTVFVKPDGGGHWYTLDGLPQYDATLRTARKEHLLPSPTSVLNIMHSEGLEKWKINQAVQAAVDLPRGAEEAEDSYGARLAERAETLRRSAAELGTHVHDGIESILSWHLWDEGEPILQRFHEWATMNIRAVDWTERVLVNRHIGVAGKADALIHFKGEAADIVGHAPCLVDWKTQKMKKSRAKVPVFKPNFYNKWIMQLAFYHSCLPADTPVVSVAINTVEPEPPYVKLWTDEERAKALDAFKAALILWQYEKNYKPELLSC